MNKLQSFLAPQFIKYIEFRSSLGFSKKSLEERAYTFDKFLHKNFSKNNMLTQEMINLWVEKRPNENSNGKRARLSTSTTFLKYLKEILYCDVYIPPEAIPKSQHFNPYILSDNDISNIFKVADTMSVHKLSPNREYVLPVLLRMMYCCALRPSEARNLLRDDVDFSNGTIFIRQSKKNKDRIIWMSEDLFKLCKRYDDKFGPRPFFFTSPTNNKYAYSWLRSQFSICLKKSELYNISPRPRLYDLRHAAVSRIILKWLKEGISSIEMLYRLKIHLGHKNFEDTMWYLHTLPNNLVNNLPLDWDDFDIVYSKIGELKNEKN
jgi:integrase